MFSKVSVHHYFHGRIDISHASWDRLDTDPFLVTSGGDTYPAWAHLVPTPASDIWW